jgi:hypothetical protein
MTETGEPFDVTPIDDPSVRYTLKPVLRYGRTTGGRLIRAPWSTWSYQLKDRPAVEVLPIGRSGPRERPQRFVLDFGDDPPGRLDVRLADA